MYMVFDGYSLDQAVSTTPIHGEGRISMKLTREFIDKMVKWLDECRTYTYLFGTRDNTSSINTVRYARNNIKLRLVCHLLKNAKWTTDPEQTIKELEKAKELLNPKEFMYYKKICYIYTAIYTGNIDSRAFVQKIWDYYREQEREAQNGNHERE